VGWRETVGVNADNDVWLVWVGCGALAGLVAFVVFGVVKALRPPDDDF